METQMQTYHRRKGSDLAAMLVATACSSVAVAQNVTPPAEQPQTTSVALASAEATVPAGEAPAAPSAEATAAPVPAAPATAPEGKIEQVTVTGSRIARKDYQSNSPVVTVNSESLKGAGPSTLESVLNNLPQFAAIRPGSTLSPSRGGRNSANLRGLGIGRTLVLLDGRRMQPSDLIGTVDLNTVPQSLIENVEVITGGASAAYGSDAIAGVVNFKLKKLIGVETDIQYGDSAKGDLGTVNASVAWGDNFAQGRGHFQMSAEYLKREAANRGQRDFFIQKLPSTFLAGGITQADAANLPSQAGLNAVFAKYGFTGNVPRNVSLGVNADGTLFTGTSTPTVPILNMKYNDPPYFIANGGTRVAQHVGESLPLQQGMEKVNFFANGSLEFSPSLTVYDQFSFVHYNSAHTVSTQGFREPTIPVTNPWIPADLAAVLASRPNPTAPLTMFWGAGRVHPLQVTTDDQNIAQAVLGIKGQLPYIKDWTYDVYASFGRATDVTHATTNVLRSAITTLLNAPDGGRSVCPGGYNPFTPKATDSDPSTIACSNFLNRETDRNFAATQKIAEATVQGTLFNLPAGEVKLATGVNFRRNSFNDNPAALAVEGALLLTVPGQYQNRAGYDQVSEYFAEANIPLLKGVPLVKELSVDVAGRNSKYKSIGSMTTYETSANWEVIKPVRLRAGFQRAIRAPNLDELFPAGGIGVDQIGQTAQGGGDPCDVNSPYRKGPASAQVRSLCAASGVPASVLDSFQFAGNAVDSLVPQGSRLKQETANTVNFGVVLKSPFEQPILKRLQLSVDYYRIRLKDAIGTISSPITLNLCFNSNGASNPGYSPSNQFCQQIIRDVNGTILHVLTPRLNLASYESSGIDTQLDWSIPMYDYGSLALNSVFSYQKKYTIQNYTGDQVINYAGTIGNGQIDLFSISHPKWKAQGSATWKYGDVSTTISARMLPTMNDSLDAAGNKVTRPGVERKHYFDLSFSWAINENMTLRAGVLNVGNTQPPYFATAPEATDTALYDILGRRFNIGLSNRF
jgi:outer membrane receptor protein involved in Fe transport